SRLAALLALLRRFLLRLGFGFLGHFLRLFRRLLGLLGGFLWGRLLGSSFRRGPFLGFFAGLFFHNQQLFLFFHAFRPSAQFFIVFQPGQLFVVVKLIFLEIHALLPMGNLLTLCSWHAAPVGRGLQLRPCDLLSHSNVLVKHS